MKRIPFSIVAACLAAGLALLLGGCATLGLGSDSPVLDRIRESGELRVGMVGDYPPLGVVDRDDELIGLEPDLARALAATLGVELRTLQMPFAELIPALEAGELDVVMAGMTMTPERNMRVAFAGPYFVSGKAVLTRSQTLARAQGPDAIDRPSLTLVTLEGSTSEGYVSSVAPNAKRLTTRGYQEAIAMVVAGEADAMVADFPVCAVAVLRNPGADLMTVVSPFTFEPIGVALPREDMLFVNLVENFLENLEGAGILEELRKKWFSDPAWLLGLP